MKKTWLIMSVILFLEVFVLFSFFILLPISFKNEEVLIPDLLYKSKNEVIEELKDFEVKTIYIESEKERDIILDVFPKTLKKVKKNSEIILYLSKGEISRKMINLENRYYEDVIIDIEELKANYNIKVNIVYENSLYLENDYIISQFPKYNQELKDEIYLVLANNISYIDIPNFIDYEIDEVIKFLKENNILYEIIYEDSYFILKNRVVKQSVIGTYYKNSPYKIQFIVSKGMIEFNFDLDLDFII